MWKTEPLITLSLVRRSLCPHIIASFHQIQSRMSTCSDNTLLKLDLQQEIMIVATLLFCFCTISYVSLVYDHVIRHGVMGPFTELKI